MALFQSVQAALQQSGASQAAAADVACNADRLMAALLEGCSDAHFRVAGAALAALGEGLAGSSSRIFEPQLDRIMTALFARWVWAGGWTVHSLCLSWLAPSQVPVLRHMLRAL